MRHVFVLWSGGLDSTYLIDSLLKQGHQVTTGYIEFENNKTQSAREQRQMKIIREYFIQQYGVSFNYLGTIARVSIEQAISHVYLAQAGIWPLAVYSIPKTATEIAFGYVMNDDAISYLNEIRAMFNGFRGLIERPVKVIFPIIKQTKQEIWGKLPQYLKENVVWCEEPSNPDVLKCGECNSCKRMINIGLMGELHPAMKKLYLKKEPPINLGDIIDRQMVDKNQKTVDIS